MTKNICIKCTISGKVQGVWFRASTQEQARKLGLTGYAKNLPDGRVEVVVCGEQEKILVLSEWLKHGPELAKVEEFSSAEIPYQEHEYFEVK